MTRKGWLLFIAISVFWGIPYFFIKIAVRELDPIIVVFARIGIAALVLVPVALQRNLLYPLHKRWGAIFVLSLVQIVGPFLLISYGEQHISSSLTSLLIAAEPLIVALLAWRFDPSEQVNGVRLLGLIIGMIGVVTLLGFDISGDAQRFLGAGFVLLAAAGYAAGALLMKRPAISSLPPSGGRCCRVCHCHASPLSSGTDSTPFSTSLASGNRQPAHPRSDLYRIRLFDPLRTHCGGRSQPWNRLYLCQPRRLCAARCDPAW